MGLDNTPFYRDDESYIRDHGLTEGQRELFLRGKKAHGLREWQGALDAFRGLLELRSDLTYVWVMRGVCEALLGQEDPAWDSLSEAVRREPDRMFCWNARIEMVFNMMPPRNDLFRRHVEEFFSRHALERYEGPLLVRMAMENYKDPELAVWMCDQTLAVDPGNKKALKLRKKAAKRAGLR